MFFFTKEINMFINKIKIKNKWKIIKYLYTFTLYTMINL